MILCETFLVVFLAPQDVPDERISKLIEEWYPHYPPERRSDMARRLSRSIPWDKWGERNRSTIQGHVQFHLQKSLGTARWHERSWASMREGFAGTSAAGMADFPPQFRERAEAIAEKLLDAYVEEHLSRGPPPAETRAKVSDQLATIEGIFLTESRRFVQGPHAEAVMRAQISDCIAVFRKDIQEGRPTGLNRSLSPQELVDISQALRNRARSMKIFSADSDPENEMNISDEDLDGANGTRAAMWACFLVLDEMDRWTKICFPRRYEATAEADRLSIEIREWDSDLIRKVNEALKADNARGGAKIQEILRKMREHEHECPSKKGHSNTVASTEPPTRRVAPAAPTPSSTPTLRWILGALGIALLLLTVTLSLRKARASSR